MEPITRISSWPGNCLSMPDLFALYSNMLVQSNEATNIEYSRNREYNMLWLPVYHSNSLPTLYVLYAPHNLSMIYSVYNTAIWFINITTSWEREKSCRIHCCGCVAQPQLKSIAAINKRLKVFGDHITTDIIKNMKLAYCFRFK